MSTKTLNTTPSQDGFRMPAEWEEHKNIWILWPERTDNWRNGAKPAQEIFVDVIKKISKHTEVILGVNQGQYANAVSHVGDLKNVKVLEISNDDSWIRDCGFTAVKNEKGEIRAVDWDFNAWGGLVDGLYFPWDKDEQVALKMAQYYGIDRYKTEGFVLEGGSIHVDGKGTVMVTEACLLSEGRNPDMSKEEIEKKLLDYLGAKKVIWLPNGIYNDETNEHVDNFANFAPDNKIVLAWTDDESDPQYAFSKAAYDILSKETSADGKPFEIIKLHTPNHVLVTKEESQGVDAIDGTLPREEGDRQAASYVNYLITNKAIILPQFDDPKHDKNAVEVLKQAYPGYTIETFAGREVVLGGGNVHCITQQVPK